jgi:hypothetical protein
MHRHAGGDERRSQIVRECVDDIADHVAALAQRDIGAGELVVTLRELHEDRRLRECDRGLIDVGRESFLEMRLERDLVAQENENAVTRGVLDERCGDRIRRGERIEQQAPERIRLTNRCGPFAIFGDAM